MESFSWRVPSQSLNGHGMGHWASLEHKTPLKRVAKSPKLMVGDAEDVLRLSHETWFNGGHVWSPQSMWRVFRVGLQSKATRETLGYILEERLLAAWYMIFLSNLHKSGFRLCCISVYRQIRASKMTHDETLVDLRRPVRSIFNCLRQGRRP